MSEMVERDAETIARMIWEATSVAWSLCIGGDHYPLKAAHYEAMKNPQPGDMVIEQSGGLRSRDCAQAVGWLESVAREPVDMEWDVEVDGPIPTEKVWYIRTIDGRECRWVNATFIAVPKHEMPWWRSPRYGDTAALA